MRNAYRILIRKLKEMRPLGRPRHRQDNISTDLWEIQWEGMNCIHLTQGSCGHCNEPPGSIKSGEFLEELSEY
jgi:hypothetical protein